METLNHGEKSTRYRDHTAQKSGRRTPPGVDPKDYFESTWENLPSLYIVRIGILEIYLDSIGGGAFPFLVVGVNFTVHFVNEQYP